MKSTLLRSFFTLVLAGACGDDDGTPGADGGDGADAPALNCAANGGADCFELPTGPMTKGSTENPANFGCAPETVMTSTGPITVTGTVFDFQNDTDEVPMAGVAAFYGDITGTPTVETTADSMGAFSITLPAGAPSRIAWRTTRPEGGLPTYALNEPLDVADADGMIAGLNRSNISTTTANALPAFIGHARTPGLGVVAGAVEDCDGDNVQHAIGTIASAPSDGNAANIQFVAGAEVYYFISGLPTRRSQRQDTNTDGLFVAIEIPVTASGAQNYLQVWGFTSAADMAMGTAGLKLISEVPTPVLGDTVLAVGMNPNQGPL